MPTPPTDAPDRWLWLNDSYGDIYRRHPDGTMARLTQDELEVCNESGPVEFNTSIPVSVITALLEELANRD